MRPVRDAAVDAPRLGRLEAHRHVLVEGLRRPQLQGPLFIDDGEDDAPEAALPDGLLDG